MILTALLCIALLLGASWLLQPRARPNADSALYPECLYRVTVSDEEVVCTYPNGQAQRVLWSDLTAVRVFTNDTGPWGCDVVWVLYDRSGNGACVIPGGASGEQLLLSTFKRLPGFNEEEVIKAMGCTGNAVFLCWSQPEPQERPVAS